MATIAAVGGQNLVQNLHGVLIIASFVHFSYVRMSIVRSRCFKPLFACFTRLAISVESHGSGFDGEGLLLVLGGRLLDDVLGAQGGGEGGEDGESSDHGRSLGHRWRFAVETGSVGRLQNTFAVPEFSGGDAGRGGLAALAKNAAKSSSTLAASRELGVKVRVIVPYSWVPGTPW